MERWMDVRRQRLDRVGQQVTIAYFFNTLDQNHKSAIEIVLQTRDGHRKAMEKKDEGEIPRNNESFHGGICKVQDHTSLLIGCRC